MKITKAFCVRLCAFVTSFLSLFPVLPLAAQNYSELSEQALLCIERDSLLQAEQLLKQALQLEPANVRNALLLANLGTVQQKMNRTKEAIDSYSLSLNLAPKMTSVLLSRASLYVEQKKNDEAFLDYCSVLDQEPENVDALLMRAYIYWQRRDYEAARIDYHKHLELNPKSYSGRMGMVALNQARQRYDEALLILASLTIDYPDSLELYLMRANIEQERGHPEQALIDLEDVLRKNPQSGEAYAIRGEVFLTLKKYRHARSDFLKARSLGVSAADMQLLLEKCK